METALEVVQTLEVAEVLETSAEELWTSLEAVEELEMVGMQQCLQGVIIALSTMMVERSNNWTLVGRGPAL